MALIKGTEYVNSKTGETYSIGLENDSLNLSLITGIASPPVKPLSYKAVKQKGQSFVGNTTDVRQVLVSTFTGQLSVSQYEAERKRLGRVHENTEIEKEEELGRLRLETFGGTKYEMRRVFPKDVKRPEDKQSGSINEDIITIEYISHDPYIYEREIKQVGFSEEDAPEGQILNDLVLNDFDFNGIDGNIREANNEGSVSTPPRIILFGALTNAKITNLTTGRFIELEKELQANERLVVNVYDKTITLIDANGEESSAEAFLTKESSLVDFNLAVGSNVIELTSQSNTARIQLQWQNRFTMI